MKLKTGEGRKKKKKKKKCSPLGLELQEFFPWISVVSFISPRHPRDRIDSKSYSEINLDFRLWKALELACTEESLRRS